MGHDMYHIEQYKSLGIAESDSDIVQHTATAQINFLVRS